MAEDEKELKDQRVVTMMSPSELETIDDWMFKNRIRSRGEAIRRLCQIALATDSKLDAIFELSAGILKRRTKAAKAVTDGFRLMREEGSVQANFVGNLADNNGDALSDHARLFLAIHSLFGPLGLMKTAPDIDEALRFASQAKEGLDDIRSDIKLVDDALTGQTTIERTANQSDLQEAPKRSGSIVDIDVDAPDE